MILPAAVTRYLEAANRFDPETASRCFTPDALVHDESKDYRGTDDIHDWVQATSQKYRPRFEVKHFDSKDDQVLLTAEVSGNFPGSPIELDYEIALSGGLISKLVVL